MSNNGFFIDDGHFEISKEQMAKLAKELEDNNPMHDINRHNNEELRLLNDIMAEMKNQAKDADNKHKQSMTKANYQITWAVVAAIIAFLTLVFTFFPELVSWIKQIYN